MTQEELVTALETTSIPIVYGEFEEEVNAPFITYQFSSSADIKADNQNYVDISGYQVELYTDKKSPVTEKLVQDVFKLNGLVYSKYESRISEEKLYQIVYTIQLI
ncbi:MAG TPA: hypothetical protein DCP90_01990 [Clostridiales bacterium]|nr:MAG: hypothetical protein A2Y22_08670 [Clostridiales bacterium GWD2_32_59]HAN09364.1 hypothetical protein [Clostridiales bacterium]